MLLDNCPYVVAFLVTATVHMGWSSIPGLVHRQFILLACASSSAAASIIKLHAFALLLLLCSLSIKATSSTPVEDLSIKQTYDFDDLKTTNGLGSIRSDGLFSFEGFAVMDPSDLKLPYIQPFDRNCATSPPNALLGSRYGQAESRPVISINATAAGIDDFQAVFDLHRLSIKPLAMSAGLYPFAAIVTIRGGTATAQVVKQPLMFQVEWPAGYTEPLLIDMDGHRFSKDSWTTLQWLEFSVDFGPSKIDWEFCLDDLVVGFTKSKEDLDSDDGDGGGEETGNRVKWEI